MRIKTGLLFLGIFLISILSVSAYTYSNPSYTQYTSSGGILGGFGSSSLRVDSSLCSPGTDFLMQIEPLSCEPAVVRSDLLEENDVTVYCKIAATQINPLVDINSIKYITMNGNYPSEVKSIGYVPSDSALGNYNYDLDINNIALNNMGYVAITLRQNPNESSMPSSVQGNLTARLTYDIQNSFGVGNAEFYLPVLNDNDFNDRINQYSFWNGRGYLRAESVNDGSATISLYSGSSMGSSSKQRVSQVRLDKGETSSPIYLPGLSSCLATLEFRLNDVVDANTRARLKINSDYVEVSEGETFLDGKCQVRDIQKDGLNQKVTLSCKGDDKTENFDLRISPSISIKVNDLVGNYTVGDKIYTSSDNSKAVYLGYVGTKGDTGNLEDLYAVLVSLPEQKDKLTDSEISSLASQMNMVYSSVNTGASVVDTLGNAFGKILGTTIAFGKWSVSGQNTKTLEFKDKTISPVEEFEGIKFSLSGFAQAQDQGVVSVIEDEYDLVKKPFVSGISLKDAYEIRQNGVSKGAYLVISSDSEGSPKLYLQTSGFTGSVTSGTFYGNNCNSHAGCNDYSLSQSELYSSSDLSWFFDNLVSADVLNQNKLVLKKLSFSANSGESYYNYYKSAISDYETVQNSFSSKIDSSSSETYGEKALYNSIVLSEKLGQRKTMGGLCQAFKESYPDSDKSLSMCEDSLGMSNSEIASKDVLINNKVKEISFGGIYEPSYADYGAEITVKGPNGKVQSFQLRKDSTIYLSGFRESADNSSGTEYIRLGDLDTDKTSVKINVNGQGAFAKLLSTNTYTLNKNTPESFGSQYTFTLTNTNIKKYAKVSIIPSFNYQDSTSTFPFKIGIEKRAIQLSDDQIKNKIESLNSSIKSWEKLSDNLNTFNTYLGDACLVTGGWITIKNFIQNSDGKSIARQKVMTSKGGWNEYCQNEVSKGNYVSLDDCFFKNSDKIDAQVDQVSNQITNQNNEIKNIQDSISSTTSVLGTKTINDAQFMEQYSVVGASSIAGLGSSLSDPNGKLENINLDEMKNTILTSEGYNKGYYTVDDLKNVELYSDLLQGASDDQSKEFYAKQLYSTLYNIRVNAESLVKQDSFKGESGLQYSSSIIQLDKTRKTTEIPITVPETFATSEYSKGYTFATGSEVIISTEYVYAVRDQTSGERYLFVYELDKSTGIVKRTYKITGSVLNQYSTKDAKTGYVNSNPFDLVFKKYDSTSYQNKYTNPEVRYYEDEPYKGYPALVPLDTKNGWYTATKPKLGTGSTIASYDASGKVESLWLCNVGLNGLEEFVLSSHGDDVCEQINLGTGQPYNQFPGLSESEASKLVTSAVNSIEAAQKAHNSGVSKVKINGVTYTVGSPAVETPAAQCTDFMSPKDCKLLFNVCDPVICPSSRCDFGGNYPVKDVVQSGIIGSIALCAPNYREGIIVPICTTGVEAGMDSWISVQKSYRDCLQENLDTGATIGICDEIHSIYSCEFFWKQALPLTKITLSKLAKVITGENVRGGGEYLSVQSSWDNAKNSLDYFKQNYAAEAYNAFKLKSIDQAGTDVCKVSLSVIYPSGADLVNTITSPRSPPQFTGTFSETSLSTVTNPPTSHYKVFYHIYAGEDTGAYYQVYLKGSSSSSYYQDTSYNRAVASGYVNAGDYATETKDIQAPTGYTQLCVVVNGQEECGFSKVSTSFAVNYVNDLYLAEQSTQKVTTESGCVSGTASIYSLLNPNAEGAVDNLIDPAIYQQGIIRVCATASPGKGTDANDGTESARWRNVGYCGDSKVRCWIDTDSVKNAIKSLDVESSALNDTAQNYLDSLVASGSYISNQDFANNVSSIESETDNSKKIGMINGIIDKVFFSNQKAQLYLLRGSAYGGLAEDAYSVIKNTKTVSTSSISSLGTVGDLSTSGVSEYTFSLGVGEEHTFSYGGSDYVLKVTRFSSNLLKADISISPVSKTATLGIGSGSTFDLDGKDSYDINLFLSDIKNQKAEFILDVYPTTLVCTLPTVPSNIALINIASERVLAAAESLKGTSALKGSVVQDYDRSGSINCFDSTVYVYNTAGVTYSCAYSDKLGKSYTYNGNIIKTDNKIFFVNENKCALVGLSEKDKLDNIKPGDMLSIVYSHNSGHNVIFINWTNPSSHTEATIFDWINKDSNGNKVFNYRTIDLSDNHNTVYMYWEPVLYGTSTSGSSSGSTGSSTTGLDSFSDFQKTIYNVATLCEDCQTADSGKGDICTEDLCALIGQKLKVTCSQNNNVKGTCVLNKNAYDSWNSFDEVRNNLNMFSEKEQEVISSATKCSDCGNGLTNFCDAQECKAISLKIDKTCFYGILSCS